MKQINGITDEAIQDFTTRAENGEIIKISLRYMPTIQRWFVGLQYKDFILNGYRVYVSDNILWTFRNILPFGLAVTCKEFEPFMIDDFSAGRAKFFLLNRDEVDQLEAIYKQAKAL
jgi:hypothetical protein